MVKTEAFFPAVHFISAAQPTGCVIIDAEEDFDWRRPVQGVPHSVRGMQHLSDLQHILAAYGAIPIYLVTYPVLQDDAVVAAIRLRLERGDCEVGIQLHTWVTPPFNERADLRNSFGGNLDAALEERKLVELMRLFRLRFGHDPVVFKAGRYGLGPHTSLLLEKHGFRVDTSLAPRTSFAAESGPDFSANDYRTFWFGRSRRLLEVPLCRSIVGWGGRASARAYQLLADLNLSRLHLPGVLAWLRCAERITLSPEGNDPAAMCRLARSLLSRGQNVLAISLHSSSLSIGHNPYVRSRAELYHFYDRLSAILDQLAGRFAVRFARCTELPELLADG
jgi:hypothetical protein